MPDDQCLNEGFLENDQIPFPKELQFLTSSYKNVKDAVSNYNHFMMDFVTTNEMNQNNFVPVSKCLLELEDIEVMGSYQSLNKEYVDIILDENVEREDGGILYHISVSLIRVYINLLLNLHLYYIQSCQIFHQTSLLKKY